MHTSASKLYIASAGSGKTFTLTVEYLKLTVPRPDEYKRILAVTFTKKATGEMKDRILGALYNISKGKEPGDKFLVKVKEQLQASYPSEDWTEERIRTNAGKVLKNILHDYSHFRIETIDSFFQSILRGLMLELGIGTMTNVDLDTDGAVSDAVDRIYEQLPERPDLRDWIKSFTDEKLNEEKGWHVDREIKSFARHIFDEQIIDNDNALRYTSEDIAAYKKSVEKVKHSIEAKAEAVAEEFESICRAAGAKDEDFYYGSKGLAGIFKKLKNLSTAKTNTKVIAAQEEGSQILKKGSKLAIDEARVRQLIREAVTIVDTNRASYNTATLVLKNLHCYGLLREIREQINAKNEEDGTMLLAYTAPLLKKMIGDDTTPFIYERVGTEIRHIMIDEFQDTSGIQWHNFVPLLKENAANGGFNLIVGDPKQSIYRWRNGDWRLMDYDRIADDTLPSTWECPPMENNFRSQEQVVEFNNEVFASCSKIAEQSGVILDDRLRDKVESMYKTARQNHQKEQRKGYVEVQYYEQPKDDKDALTVKKWVLEALRDKILELRSQGIKDKDIAILTRKNSEIRELAQMLAGDGIKIVSNEAFQLDFSVIVCVIIQALRYIANPSDAVAKICLFADYNQAVLHRDLSDLLSNPRVSTYEDAPEFQQMIRNIESCKHLPLYEMIEELYFILFVKDSAARGDEDFLKGQDSYLYTFFDGVSKFISRHSSDLTRFLEHWDSKLSRQAIEFGGDVEGIRALTIHKSKGLEFKTVIIPLATWELAPKTINSPVLWCNADKGDALFAKIKPLPISYSKNTMANSLFEAEYKEEQSQAWVDGVNLLYVALTRAEDNLIVFSGKKEKKNESDTLDSVSKLLSTILAEEYFSSKRVKLPDDAMPGLSKYVFGELCLPENKKEKATKTDNPFERKPEEKEDFRYESFRSHIKFRQSNASRQFIADEDDDETGDKDMTYINRGKLLHQLFSLIRTKSDVEKAVHTLEFEGVLSGKEQSDELIAFAHDKISRDEVKEWFAEGKRYMNERTIAMRGEDGILINHRPDRVIIDGNKVKIVDFKFGRPHRKHHTQVREYSDLLRRMGYTDIEAYLWYVIEDRIETVDLG